MLRTKILVLLLITSSIVSSQTVMQDTADTDNNFHTFNTYLNYGYGISYDAMKSNNSIFRLHLDIYNYYNNNESDETNEHYYEGGQNKYIQISENKDLRFDISFAPLYLYKFYDSDIGFAYFGGGPRVGYSIYDTEYKREEIEEVLTGTSKTISSSEYDETSYSAGAMFIVGLRAKLTKNLGVFIESHLNIDRIWRNYNDKGNNIYNDLETSRNKHKRDSDSWSLNYQISRLGISISI